MLIFNICLSDLPQSVWQILGPSTSLRMTQFHSFLWLILTMGPWIPLIYKRKVTIVCPGFTGSPTLSSFSFSVSSTLTLLLLHRSLDTLYSSPLLYILDLCLSLLSVQHNPIQPWRVSSSFSFSGSLPCFIQVEVADLFFVQLTFLINITILTLKNHSGFIWLWSTWPNCLLVA